MTETLKPGDIIFYPDDGEWKHHIFALMQKWAGEMGKLDGTVTFTHVGMVSTEPDLMIDMKWPRPRFSFIADDQRKRIVMRPRCGEDIKTRAIYWFYFNIDTRYSFLDMVLGNLGLLRSYKFCSGMVDRAFKEAGFAITPMDDRIVSPNELASSDKLDFIEEVSHG